MACGWSRNMRVAYNALLHLYANVGKADSARAVLDTMLQDGPAPDAVTFNSMIHAYIQVRCPDGS